MSVMRHVSGHDQVRTTDCDGPYCEACGDCVRCYAEDECTRSPDGKHHA